MAANRADRRAKTSFVAVEWGDPREVKRILASTPHHRDARDAAGETPLHVTARAGHAALVVLLLDRGARTQDRQTPTDLATRAVEPEVLRIPVPRGGLALGPPGVPTPLHAAAEIANDALAGKAVAISSQLRETGPGPNRERRATGRPRPGRATAASLVRSPGPEAPEESAAR